MESHWLLRRTMLLSRDWLKLTNQPNWCKTKTGHHLVVCAFPRWTPATTRFFFWVLIVLSASVVLGGCRFVLFWLKMLRHTQRERECTNYEQLRCRKLKVRFFESFVIHSLRINTHTKKAKLLFTSMPCGFFSSKDFYRDDCESLDF